MNSKFKAEQVRLQEAYELRQHRSQDRPYFQYEDRAHLLRVQQRQRESLRLLAAVGCHSLRNKRWLEVGCGEAAEFAHYLAWGIEAQNLCGIDLRSSAIHSAQQYFAGSELQVGCATELPWPDSSFDVVAQHTVFSSILDLKMRQAVASEMIRVLKPGGLILWYDSRRSNPHNADVQAVTRAEIESYFPHLDRRFKAMTYWPHHARRWPATCLEFAYPVLSSIPFFCSHWLGLFQKEPT